LLASTSSLSTNVDHHQSTDGDDVPVNMFTMTYIGGMDHPPAFST